MTMPDEFQDESGSRFRLLAPEETEDEVILANIDGVGPTISGRLVEYFGTPAAVFDATVSELRNVDGVTEKLAIKIIDARKNNIAKEIIRFCVENGIDLITIDDVRYPAQLREIARPPRLLYVRGSLLPRDARAISIVGTRNVTEYGRLQAERLARGLAERGFTIISGLANGIDGVAHRAALEARGRTIAVLGSGIAKIYPVNHENLALDIMKSGAVMSEYHPLMGALAGNFPARNRIVSGLSLGTIVVESDVKGGSMITARLALEQNREVMAVPGPIGRSSSGCHQLIRENAAALVESVEDVLNVLPEYETREIERAPQQQSLFDKPDVEPGSAGLNRDSVKSLERLSSQRKPRKTSPQPVPDREEPRPSEPSTPPPAPRQSGPSPELLATLTENERAIVSRLTQDPTPIDELIQNTGLPSSRVLCLVAALEFKRVVRRREGAAVSLATPDA